MAKLGPSFSELKGLSSQDLRNRYDEANEAGQPWGVNFYRDELRRRESRQHEWVLIFLTAVITVLTAANLYAVLSDGHHRHRYHHDGQHLPSR